VPVDPNSHVPIYEQIADHLRGAVAAGVYRPGEPLPSIRALALELLVNPNTVQRAYQELERQGLLYTRKGLGAFVAEGGERSARNGAAAAVRARFAEGIELGRAARMSPGSIRGAFEEQWDESTGTPEC